MLLAVRSTTEIVVFLLRFRPTPRLKGRRVRIAITGASGQLGQALRLTCPPHRRDEVRWCTHTELDITDPRRVARIDATLIINAAAHTAVDTAESEPEYARAINAIGPALLAAHAERTGAFLVHVSTDYVFGDRGDNPQRTPWLVDDPCRPRSVYGITKREGEKAVEQSQAASTIVRTAWVYSGTAVPESKDFVSTMMRLENTYEQVTVVDDQWGNPTYAIDLARGIWEIVDKHEAGGCLPPILHCVGGGNPVTWYTLAREVFQCVGADPDRVIPVDSAAFPRPAPRPAYSALDTSLWREAGLHPLPEWRNAVQRAVTGSIE